MALSEWNRVMFGDICKQLNIREDIVRVKEELFEENPTAINRMILQRAQEELRQYLYYKEEYWR